MGRDPDLQNYLWRQIRLGVLKRDGYRCYQCGEKANTVDHITPRRLGGTHHPSNLRACCARCNSLKGDRAPAVPMPSRVW